MLLSLLLTHRRIPEIRVQPLALEGFERGGGKGAGAAALVVAPSAALPPTGLSRVVQWLAGGSPAPAAQPFFTSFLLLACDGVWDVLSNEEACEFISRDIIAAAAAAEAAAAAPDGGSSAEAASEAAAAAASAYLGGTAERLRSLVLERTSREVGVPARMLLSLRPGKGGRRDVHDDITVVICFVGGLQSVTDLASRAQVQPEQLR